MSRNLNAAVSGKAALPQLTAKMLEELIPGPVTKEQFTDIFENFKKAFIERALNAEMSHHLGYGVGQAASPHHSMRRVASLLICLLYTSDAADE